MQGQGKIGGEKQRRPEISMMGKSTSPGQGGWRDEAANPFHTAARQLHPVGPYPSYHTHLSSLLRLFQQEMVDFCASSQSL